MQTYKYRFPAEGVLEEKPKDAALRLEKNLKDSPDCLMTYCIFPSDSTILDYVSFEGEKTDGAFKISAINAHTFTQPYENTDGDFMDCMAVNLMQVLPGVKLSGNMEALGLEGKTPDVLYHITEQKNVEAILKEGLIPGSGANQYKSHEDYVYLAQEGDLAPWLAVLPHLEDPAILKVDASMVSGLEPGRTFTDRSYVEGMYYGEYRTKNPIPASAIEVLAPDSEVMGYVAAQMEAQAGKAMSAQDHVVDDMTENELNEVLRGQERMKAIRERDDFSKAVESIPYQQMTLADYGYDV